MFVELLALLCLSGCTLLSGCRSWPPARPRYVAASSRCFARCRYENGKWIYTSPVKMYMPSVLWCCRLVDRKDLHDKSLSRHETVIINRLRTSHTRLTHSYLLSGDDQPTCSTCGHPLTVCHKLLDCIDLQDVRRRHFSVTWLRDLFETVDNRIIDFIKDTRFYSLL